MIHSMLQTENYKEIEELTILTSDYLRYLFMVNQDFHHWIKKIQHIKDYLEIQRIRYGDNIHFALEFDNELQHALVPSLLLQTFIEIRLSTVSLSKMESPSTFLFKTNRWWEALYWNLC